MSNNNPYNDSNQNSIDIKAYFFKVLSYWQLFLVAIIIGFIVAKFMNGYKEKRYSLDTTISVKEENNPLFSTGTNIAFNWGGESNEIGTVKVVLGSRTHNEKVVDSLQFYIDYLKDGRYRLVDDYGNTPFKVVIHKDKPQIFGKLIKVEAISATRVKISFDFDVSNNNRLILYTENIKEEGTGNKFSYYTSSEEKFTTEVSVGESITNEFLNFTFSSTRALVPGEYNYIRFNHFDGTVARYRNVRVTDVTKGASILRLQQEGSNKYRIVDYLNTSVKVLEKDKKEQKIAYAKNTKEYIDNLFEKESDSLKNIEQAISRYKLKNNIYNLSDQGVKILEESTALDKEKRELTSNIETLDSLNIYILTHKKYTQIPVPALIKVADNKIPVEIGDLIAKSTAREALRDKVTDNHPEVKSLVKEIETIKSILLENIKNLKITLRNDLSKVNKRQQINLSKQKTLPEKEQGLINFQRNYNISESNYNYLKQKSYEAGTSIAASVSDVKIIDTAKDLGQGPIYPIPNFNYLVALMLSVILPLFYIIIREILDNKIHTVEEIEKNYVAHVR